MIRAHALQQYDLDVLAERHAWERMEIPPNTNFMISFKKMDIRLNFWLSTGTVASCLLHPKQGKTQLFRRKVTLEEAEQIFINPRIHTGKFISNKSVVDSSLPPLLMSLMQYYHHHHHHTHHHTHHAHHNHHTHYSMGTHPTLLCIR